jgi:predicted transcriptional regulator
MLKSVLFAALSFLSTILVYGGNISEGYKIEPWELQDNRGNLLKSADFNGKVLMVNYLSPDESDLNSHLADVLEKAMQSGALSPEKCVSMGIIDCKASWKPDYLIREFAARKVEKYSGSKVQLLFDYKASIRNDWGFEKGSSNIIIIDKNGICRAVVKGRVPDERLNDLLALVKFLQNETVALAGL